MNQENLLGLSTIGPYRKPTQVDGCDYTQAYERNIVQELGKKSGRNFGIRPGFSREGETRSERYEATVYQKHRPLLNRKMMYRG